MDPPSKQLLRRAAALGGPPDETVNKRLMARAGAALWFAGAVLISLSLLVPHAGLRDETGLVWVLSIAFVVAAILWLGGGRLPWWSFQIAAVGGTVLISDAIYFDGVSSSFFAFFYLWVSLYSFYFFSRTWATLQAIGIGIGFWVALTQVGEGGPPAGRYLTTIGTVVVAGIFVSALVERVRRHASESDQRAEALRQSEELTRRVVDSAHDAFISIDPDGLVTGWNPRATDTFGWQPEEILGRDILDTLIPDRHRQVWTHALSEIRDTRRHPLLDRRVELETLDRDARELLVEATMSLVPTGGSYVLTAFLHDISARKRAEELIGAQHGVTRVLSEAVTIEEAGPALLQGLCRTTGWDYGTIWRADSGGRVLTAMASWASEELDSERLEASAEELALRAGVGLPGRVWSKGEPTWVPDIEADAGLLRTGEIRDAGLRSALALPIVAGTTPFGVLEFFSVDARTEDPALVQTLATIATQIGHFVARRSAEQQVVEQAEQMAIVAEATRDLARMTGAQAARPAICEAAVKVSGASWTVLYEPSPDGVGLRVTAGHGESVPGLLDEIVLPFVGERTAAVAAFGSREAIFVADTKTDPRVSQKLAQLTGASSVLVQPVVRQEQALGVLVIGWEQPVPHLSDRVRAITGLLSAEAAVAIERADLLVRLETVARTDDLTGLANRRAWDEELPRELARAKRERGALCVAMLDLDRFKDFNDRRGHQAGDRFLKQAAAAWREQLRTTDVIARYGGEEFAVVLPSCGLDEALPIVERLREATPLGESCSAGIACWDGTEPADSLVARADAALYAAKDAGRDRTVVAA